MKGRRYYSFAPPGNLLAGITTPVEFFALDSTYLDREQLAWLDKRLAASAADWKICLPPPPDLHLRPLPACRAACTAPRSSRCS